MKKIVLLLIVYCLLFIVVKPVGAQADGVDIGEWFKLGEISIKDFYPDFSSFGAFISSVLPNVYVIAGIILVFLLIFGGFAYIMNAGKQDKEGIQKGKNAITAALIGFGLIFGSWWIIQIVEVITGVDILK